MSNRSSTGRRPELTPDPRMQDLAADVLRGFRDRRSREQTAEAPACPQRGPHAVCAAEARIIESNFDFFDETFPGG